MEQEIEADGCAQHFGQVASDDGQLAEQPQGVRNTARIFIAAGLRQDRGR